jgi:hypothetical protein
VTPKPVTAGLFGPEVANRRENAPEATEYREASARWARRFRVVYPYDYPWHGRCNRHVSQLLEWAGSVEILDAIYAAYLADKWRGYDGHRLASLWRDRERFRARVTASRRGNASPARRATGSTSGAIL